MSRAISGKNNLLLSIGYTTLSFLLRIKCCTCRGFYWEKIIYLQKEFYSLSICKELIYLCKLMIHA